MILNNNITNQTMLFICLLAGMVCLWNFVGLAVGINKNKGAMLIFSFGMFAISFFTFGSIICETFVSIKSMNITYQFSDELGAIRVFRSGFLFGISLSTAFLRIIFNKFFYRIS